MSKTPSGRPRWARQVSGVLIALTQSRYLLRKAAQRTGDRRLADRLRRLARRRRAAVAELETLNPPPQTSSEIPDVVGEELFPTELRTATEIGAIAACLRANRRLRVQIESALAAEPPPRIVARLEALRDQTDRDAAGFNSRLRELVAHPVAAAADPTHLPPSVADQPPPG